MAEHNSPLHVVLADDHPLIIDGLKKVLSSDSQLTEVVGECNDWRTCVSQVGQLKPDILITDLEMPGGQGLKMLESIAREHPSLKIVVISMFFNARLLNKLHQIGIAGYLNKSFGENQLIEAIETVISGRTFVASPEKKIYDRIASNASNFSAKQENVLALLSLGYQTKEISRLSGVTVSYAQTIIRDVKRKHNLKDRVELVDFSRQQLPDVIEKWSSQLNSL